MAYTIYTRLISQRDDTNGRHVDWARLNVARLSALIYVPYLAEHLTCSLVYVALECATLHLSQLN